MFYKILKAVFAIIIIVLLLEITSKFTAIPSIFKILSSKNDPFELGPTIIEYIQEKKELISQRFYSDKFFDTSIFYNNRDPLSFITTSTVDAGFDFDNSKKDIIKITNDKIALVLPAPKIYEPNIINIDYIVQHPSWSQDDLNNLYIECKKYIYEDALRSGLLKQCKIEGVKIIKDMIRMFIKNDMEILVTISDSADEMIAKEIFKRAYDKIYHEYNNILSEEISYKLLVNIYNDGYNDNESSLMEYNIKDHYRNNTQLYRKITYGNNVLFNNHITTIVNDSSFINNNHDYSQKEDNIYTLLIGLLKKYNEDLNKNRLEFYYFGTQKEGENTKEEKTYDILYVFYNNTDWIKLYINQSNSVIAKLQYIGPFYNGRELRLTEITKFDYSDSFYLPKETRTTVRNKVYVRTMLIANKRRTAPVRRSI